MLYIPFHLTTEGIFGLVSRRDLKDDVAILKLRGSALSTYSIQTV